MGVEGPAGAGIGSALVGASESIARFLEARRLEEELKERGLAESRRVIARGQKVIGRQRAAFGASGVTREGTPQDVENATISEIHQEALRAAMPFFDRAAAIRGSRSSNLLAGILGSAAKGLATFGNAGGTFSDEDSGVDLLKSTAPSALHGPGTRVTSGGRVRIRA